LRRREFITLLTGAAAWPLKASAQQAAIPVVGYLGDISPEARRDRLDAFRNGLAEAGYVEGRNVAIEYRWAQGRYDRLPALAADLVRSRVAVIIAPGANNQALAAKAATQTIPVVFVVGGDPVESGLVASLARPGANVTGVTGMIGELSGKRIELLHELVPAAMSVALLFNPDSSSSLPERSQAAANTLGLHLLMLQARSEGEFEAAFAALVQQGAGGLSVGADPVLTGHREQIIALAALHAAPTIFPYREAVEEGGLISYGANVLDTFRQGGVYVGRILKGEKPADLPVVQPTKFELVINLKTAKAIGVTVPPALLARADEVIE
jgi:putative tryptophan/tyrosine transport system substrate-binding protein